MKRYHSEPAALSRLLAELLAHPPTAQEISGWSRQQRHEVEAWARQLRRKIDGEKTPVPPRPAMLEGRKSITGYVLGMVGRCRT